MSYTVSANGQSGSVTLNETEHVAATLQEVAVVLSTRQGSIPLYRNFGLPMRFLDMPSTAGESVMVAEVTEAIQEFVPNAEVVRVIPKYDGENLGRLYPVVEVSILHEES